MPIAQISCAGWSFEDEAALRQGDAGARRRHQAAGKLEDGPAYAALVQRIIPWRCRMWRWASLGAGLPRLFGRGAAGPYIPGTEDLDLDSAQDPQNFQKRTVKILSVALRHPSNWSMLCSGRDRWRPASKPRWLAFVLRHMGRCRAPGVTKACAHFYVLGVPADDARKLTIYFTRDAARVISRLSRTRRAVLLRKPRWDRAPFRAKSAQGLRS